MEKRPLPENKFDVLRSIFWLRRPRKRRKTVSMREALESKEKVIHTSAPVDHSIVSVRRKNLEERTLDTISHRVKAMNKQFKSVPCKVAGKEEEEEECVDAPESLLSGSDEKEDEWWDHIKSDTLIQMEGLASKFPRKEYHPCPPLVFRHHLRATLVDASQIESELEAILLSREWMVIATHNLPHIDGSMGPIYIQKKDFLQCYDDAWNKFLSSPHGASHHKDDGVIPPSSLIGHSMGMDDKVLKTIFAVFRSAVLETELHEKYFTADMLRDVFKRERKTKKYAWDDVLNVLLGSRLLKKVVSPGSMSCSRYRIGVPGITRFLADLERARREVETRIRRKSLKAMLYDKLLEQDSPNKIPMELILYDMIGSQSVEIRHGVKRNGESRRTIHLRMV
eukprot:TRINITY_DN26998_c0_g1_i1.p1 TRINITY_DN26998_c0_g1~~TRINITY_DN26998_c0_g1_i1.p1  ORF type:complete len:407 (-),score=112.93 TRINITY_DN26998_c0_g1_i1:44-1228(-)